MTEEQVKSVIDPFYTTRTTRKVGLGVPLFKMEAEMTGGSFRIDSEKGKGTKLLAEFVPSHVDMIPLGNITDTVFLLITCNPCAGFCLPQGEGRGGIRFGYQRAAGRYWGRMRL